MTVALLPTGKRYNPVTREGEYANPALVAYVLRGDYGPNYCALRVATSYGSVGWPLGHRFEAHHDQTRRSLGGFVVEGIAYPDGQTEGRVPNTKAVHWVFK